MSVPQNLIEELRNAFVEDVNTKGVESVTPQDYERVKTSDDWLRRFLLHNECNVQNALNMLWVSVNWRKDFKVNEINESTIKMDVIVQGGFFPHGRDIDGCTILVFKAKKHTKGNVDPDILKRCIVYWFERLERENKGEKISIFFDMEGCGLSNMDMEFTKYLIGLFKDYYPYFLNYIIIFEMPWVLSAAFKIIKSWLPEKAVEKIKFVGKKDIFNWVPSDQALKCWGGQNDYVFSFIPEERVEEKKQVPESTPALNKKVHFVDGTSMSEVSSNNTEKDDGGSLKVSPSGIITFVREANELVSTLELHNTDSSANISFKLKTTTPEKFRVKPSVGCLAPGASATITVTLLPGFQLGGLTKDKFLVMSTVVDEKEAADLSELWKNTSGRKVNQHRMKCFQSGEMTRNGNAVPVSAAAPSSGDPNITKLSAAVSQLTSAQAELQNSVKRTQYYQWATLVLVIFVGVLLRYIIKSELGEIFNHSYCINSKSP